MMTPAKIGEVLTEAQSKIQTLETQNARLEKMLTDIHQLLFPSQLPDHPETPDQFFARYQVALAQKARKKNGTA